MDDVDRGRPHRCLLAPSARAAAAVLALSAAALTAWLGVRNSRAQGTVGINRLVWRQLEPIARWHRSVMVVVADAVGVVIPILVAVAVVGAWWMRGRRAEAVLLAVAPALASVLVRFVLKPVTENSVGWLPHYPSGHTTASATVAMGLGLCLVRWRWRPWWLMTILVLWPLAVGVLVTGLRMHWATDVIGALGFSTATVIVVAAAVDGVRDALVHRPPARRANAGAARGPER
ncbi:MAG: phosphatase PAP2 family protein [Mycobacteriales bacterium]